MCEALEELDGFSIDDVLKVEAYMSKKTSKVDFFFSFRPELKVLMWKLYLRNVHQHIALLSITMSFLQINNINFSYWYLSFFYTKS